MAFGFTPKFEQPLELNGLDPKKYLAIALAAVKKLDWKLNYTSKSGLIAYVGGSIFSTLEEFKAIIHDDTVSLVSKSMGNGMMDWGKNKKHVEEFMQVFDEIQASVSDEQLEEMLAGLEPVFNSTEQDDLSLPPPTVSDNLKSFFSFFVPREGYFITPVIININILVFAIMVIWGVSIIEPTNDQILNWGGNFRPLTLEGQWWRLLTNVFLHIGIFHLLFNMYALLYIGLLLEHYLGRLRFVIAYLFTGIIASLTSIYWHPVTISAGASGAIFGMYGVFLAMLTTNFIDKAMRKPLLISIGVFVLFNLMNGVKAGIDNAAHIGGLVSGLVIGYSYYPSLKKPSQLNLKYLTIGILAVALASTSFIIYKQIPDDIVRYEEKMKEFARNEESALSVFKIPANTPKTDLVKALESGLGEWHKELKLLHETDKLDIPAELLVRNNILKKYCTLRIKSYEFIEMSVNEEKPSYTDSIKLYNQQIEATLNELSGK